MTAYTPGETLRLLDRPVVRKWHADMRRFRIPDVYTTVALVPCAKTKPWAWTTGGIYASYNRLRDELPHVFFITVSEPLGVVPQTHWGTFPLYDNPGLFADLSQRAGGFFKVDWELLLGRVAHTPFDAAACDQAIDRLAEVIAKFARANHRRGRTWKSFVEDKEFHPGNHRVGTHSRMLTLANVRFPFIDDSHRFLKRGGPYQQPYDYVRANL
jgi:hypothetical protein